MTLSLCWERSTWLEWPPVLKTSRLQMSFLSFCKMEAKVLPNLEDLEPHSAAFVKKKYPKYREAFNGRMATALGDQPKNPQLLQEPPRARGLAELQEFCAV
eukprot:gnl/TRDRNA2_/TRDRNA2_156061_c1_seq2.p2 gnl/TRDRNA2_/TRDRNA2_156061_c1~~gnl/TRDRNA2_/TRDRNA2_156061_c1_seq2.p2  ORF type:complete len:101 (+),score=22.81 gnl/TRDRNA2_/TRDRNA2_156061_c1_seq2:254-556(+)